MSQYKTSYSWGDCPDINQGPTSREHESRFTKKSKPESGMMMKSTASIMITGANARNHTK